MGKRQSTKTRGVSIGAATRILVIHGAEAMVKRQHLSALIQAVEAEHSQTESYTFEGKGCALADVLDELRSFSMMGRYKIVVVDDADQFVTRHRQALERYAAAPVDHTTLVLRSDRWNKGKLDKLVQKVGALIKCETMSRSAAERWLAERSRSQHDRRLDAEAAALLVARVGTNLSRLDGELAKLVLLVDRDEAIDPALIDQVVGRGSDEEAYEVQEALLSTMTGVGTGGCRATIEKIHELVSVGGQPEVLVAYFVADLVRKLSQGCQMRAGGAPDAVIARQLRLWGPRQATFMRVLDRLRPRTAHDMLDAVIDADARAKTGFGTSLRNLVAFCVRLSEAMG